jgi:transglutaminase-like putative cysteine protease
MPVFNIHHITKYEYDHPVKESVNEIRIYPFICDDQEILDHEVNITDQPDVMVINDYWDNRTGMFNLMSSHTELIIESKLIVRTLGESELVNHQQAGLDELKKDIATNLSLLELAYPKEIDLKDEIQAVINDFVTPEMFVTTIIQKCGDYIYNNFKYIKGITTVETTTKEILKQRAGVCQDFAHVMLEILRTLGIPSRYVSGYICPNKKEMRGDGATHAWVEAWVPSLGWIGMDPTNNIWATNHHVKLAVGRNFNDCSPVKGTFKGPAARQSLSVYVSVSYEDGYSFKESNNVRMEPVTGIDDLPDDFESFGQQQQQQQ